MQQRDRQRLNVHALLDQFIGAQQQRLRDLDAERLGGLQIDRECELGWLLNRKVAGLGTLENFVDIVGDHRVVGRQDGPVRNQAALSDRFSSDVKTRGQAGGRGKVKYLLDVQADERL